MFCDVSKIAQNLAKIAKIAHKITKSKYFSDIRMTLPFCYSAS